MRGRPTMSRAVSAERAQLTLFPSLGHDLAPRDAQDLMSWPFFSLAKSKRTAPIDFRMGATWISVEAVPEHGMATIWDADVLIWAASQIVAARDVGKPTSRLMDVGMSAGVMYPGYASLSPEWTLSCVLSVARR